MSEHDAFTTPGPTAPTSVTGQSPAPTDPGRVRFHLQGTKILTSFTVPTVTIDGHLVPSQYGETVYPVAPGRHRVAAQAQWLRTYGQADLAVDVEPGTVVDVWYAAPHNQFSRGSMGFEKQRRKGLVLFVGLMLAILVAIAALNGLLL